MNTTKRLSVTKHILLGTVLTVAAFATIGWGLATAAGAPSTQVFGLTFVLGLTGLGIGWLVGLVMLYFHWGFRGFVTLMNRGREHARLNEETAAADAAYAQFLASQANDPWGGTNPYGCCQTNYDVNGVLYHGAPDCKHPAILAARV